MSVRPEHVIWAWDVHIWDWAKRGLSAPAIRTKLREEFSLHAVRGVIKTMPRDWVPRGPA